MNIFTTNVVRSIVLLVAALAATACDKSNAILPSGPSGASGASVSGMVMGISGGAVTVSASSMGTPIQVASDGRFTLSNVPSGRLELRLIGTGLDARIDLGVVAANEEVTIIIRVIGSTAVLESITRRLRIENLDFTGVVARLGGNCPDLTLFVGQRAVRTNSGTAFRRVTCPLVVNGQLLQVEGPEEQSGVVLAAKVQLENAEQVDRTGAIVGLRGTCPDLFFSVSGRDFFANSATQFDSVSCTQLREGTNVEVRGHVQSNGLALLERVRRR